MARTSPVPIYTSTTQLNGTTKRRLQTASPGTTDSTATRSNTSTVVSPRRGYFVPETTMSTNGEPILPVGSAFGTGWGFAPHLNGVVPLVTDGVSYPAGDWRVRVPMARDGGLTSANQTGCTISAVLFRANSNATSFPQEIGRASSAIGTMTTTRVDFLVVVPGAAVTFAPSEILWLELHYVCGATTSVTGSFVLLSTNSTTGVRFDVAPPYTINYQKALPDSAPATEALSRFATYSRNLDESIPLTDTVMRVATFRRSLSDTASAVGDTLRRLVSYNRNLSESSTVADDLTRLATYNRRLEDSAPAVDTLSRRAAYARALSESVPLTDTITRIATFNRRLFETSTINDTLTRLVSYNRRLNDTAPVADSLTRRATYARALLEELATGGGGTTIVYKRSTYVFDD